MMKRALADCVADCEITDHLSLSTGGIQFTCLLWRGFEYHQKQARVYFQDR